MAKALRRKDVDGFVHWLRARGYLVDMTATTWTVGDVSVGGQWQSMFYDSRSGNFGRVLLPAPLQTIFEEYLSQKHTQKLRQGRQRDE